MGMTKSDFETLQNGIRAAKRRALAEPHRETSGRLLEGIAFAQSAIADEIQRSNPHFCRLRFARACEINPEAAR